MIILNEKTYDNVNTKISFKNNGTANCLVKLSDIFIKSQENLSSTRFVQDTATNWFPKVLFSRSKADFAEISFLEFLESVIFYFALPILGEKVFRNGMFKNLVPNNMRNAVNEQLPNSIIQIEKNKSITKEIKRRTIANKAGILLACCTIPVAEYTLSFAKNLFTLKVFKQSNFNSIANLNSSGIEKEDKIHQERVETHSKEQIKKSAIISGLGVVLGIILAFEGHKSDCLQKISKTIINPGKTIAKILNIQNKKIGQILSAFSLDFRNNNGKLALSKGQLALTAIIGLLGYSNAAKDRSKLDVAEVWTRVPLVVFYTIVGSELFEKSFIKFLEKRKKFTDLIQRTGEGNLITPLREELPKIAKKIAKERKTEYKKELARLTKEKAFIQGVPYAFSLVFMGFILSAITRLWTQFRYNKMNKDNKKLF